MTEPELRGPRACAVCGASPADLPVIEDTGELSGWLCEQCERKHRHRRMGWSRRLSRRLRRWLQI